MRRPDSARGATRLLVTGLLALAACGREDALSDTTRSKSIAAALESGTDLVVTQVRGPASVRNGQSFQTTVTVCNQGTEPTSFNRPRLELFLSMDAELSLSDPNNPPPSPPTDQVSIGAWDLDSLQPGQCVTKSMPAQAWLPPAAQGDGAYYLAAAVDTLGVEQEAREDNNVHVGGLLGVGDRADLVVTGVSGPASVRSWQSFTATVTVCNQGTTSSTGGYYPYYGTPRVELFLSMDTELTLPDPNAPSPSVPTDQVSIGYLELGQMYEGQCVTTGVPVNANLPPEAQGDGAYYLVAAVDTNGMEQELREDNNVRVGSRMGVGNRSDLVVTRVESPASALQGQDFTAKVKVCNAGTAPSAGYPSRPRVELFLTSDATGALPADPAPLGSLELDVLYEGQCVTKSVPAHAWPPPESQSDGAYYLVATVDRAGVEQELREDNNVHVGGLLGVGYRSDLVVSEVSGPANVWDGQNFTANVKVCNQGTEHTNGNYYSRPRVELFLSTRPELAPLAPGMPSPGSSSSQVSIGYTELDMLQQGQCVTTSVHANAWLPPEAQSHGAYYLIAVVDSLATEHELREDNNILVSGLMGVGYRADLVVTEVERPASVRDGQSFPTRVKVCNQGTAPTQSNSYPYYSSVRVELFLSMDTELTLPSMDSPYPPMPMDQMSMGSVDIYSRLEPAQCVTVDMPAYASLPPTSEPGAYYLFAAVDPLQVEQELREDNNVHLDGLIGVGHRPDFVVTEVSGPASVRDGREFTATVKVCNQGTTSSSSGYPSTRVDLYLSTDTELTLPSPGSPNPPMAMDQTTIGSVEFYQPLEPGQCVTKSVPANAWSPPEAQGNNGAWYLAAVVDPQSMQKELREDNNVHVGGLMGVGHGADLVVTELTGPASVRDGQDFTATVKVCNQGTASSTGGPYYNITRLELFLSASDTLSMPEQSMPYPEPVGAVSVGYVELSQQLYPGQCTTKSVPAHAYLPPTGQGEGAYYLAAAVDTNWTEWELREDNNVHVGGLMGVGHRSDLVVTEVSHPASVENGQTFTATVKVCNQGTAPTSGSYYYYSRPRVELFLSTDAELTLPSQNSPYPSPDMPRDQTSIGSVELEQPLSPSQCVTKSMSAYASLPPASHGDGAYYLAAAVDTTWVEQELREDNNVHVSGLMGVGYKADLVVTEVSGPASAGDGQEFTATVKVCNQGSAPTGNGYYYSRPRVELFLSTDDELTLPSQNSPYPSPGMPMDQTSIGSVELDQTLYPSQCVTKSVPAYASPPPAGQGDGAYYLAAAVDIYQVEQELREDNNVRVGNLMGVGHRSDLVVTEVSGPASAGDGQQFTATVKVCNQGVAPTNSYNNNTRVELFLSTVATLSVPDSSTPGSEMPLEQTSIGSVDLYEPLYPGQCVTKSVSAYASPPPAGQGDGAYYLAAAVDTNRVEQELREDNNIRVGNLMGVGHRSDLVVTEVSGPASVSPGYQFTATVTVCNQGTAPTQNGYYPYYSRPQVELFLSTDATLSIPSSSQDMPLDQASIGYAELYDTLYPSQCVTLSMPATPWLPPEEHGEGAYYLAAAVDTNRVEQELREDNNVHVSGVMGVGNRSDLVVSEVSGPASVGYGQQFTATVKVCNQGTASTSGSYYSRPRVELYLSMDTELTLPTPNSPYPSPDLTRDQELIGTLELYEPLSPSQCVTTSVPAHAVLPRDAQGDSAYYLAAVVDTTWVEQELREDNNIRVGGLMGLGNRSDLVVSAVSGPASVGPGQEFSAAVKVCNQGTAPTSDSYYSRPRVELFLSTDTTLELPSPGSPYPPQGPSSEQASIGSLELDQPLAPSQCVTKNVTAYASSLPGTQDLGAYYLAAAVDTTWVEQELREDNNVRVGGLMGVGNRSDLVVSEVSGPANVEPGQSFMASVKVCNQGTVPTHNNYYSGNTRVELYLSTDTELTLPAPNSPYPSPGMPVDQIYIGSLELYEPLFPSQCVTKSVQANAWPPPASQGDGAYYLVAAVDTTWVEYELREDNNVHVGDLLGVGHRSDLVVSEVSGPASVQYGQGFTATVKVCNQGTTPAVNSYYSRPRVELYLSKDTELTLPSQGSPYPSPDQTRDQALIGSVELYEPLYPSQCVTKSVSVSADLPSGMQEEGAYYLGAAVDTTWVENELREDNNVRIGHQVGVGHRSDLVISEVSGPSSASNGQPFTATVKVCNQGSAPTSGSFGPPRVELYLSMDTELTLPLPNSPYPSPDLSRDQELIGSVHLDQPLNPSQCVTTSVPAHAVLPRDAQGDGAFYLAAAVDTTWVEQELREDNNVRVGGLMGVGNRSDLVVSEVSGPSSVWNGADFTATVKVCNQGSAPISGYSSNNTRIELYLSMDTELTLPTPNSPYPSPGMPRDQEHIGSEYLNESLYPGQCVTKTVFAHARQPWDAQGDGAYYLAAAVDTTWVEQELREDNNIRVGGLMGVGHRSDLVVSEVSGPASVEYGQNFTVAVKVCNQGMEPTSSYNSSRPRVELFLSKDTTLELPAPGSPYPSPGMPSDQAFIGSVELDQPLYPSQCVTKSVSAWADLPSGMQEEGAYYLAAAVDTTWVEQELREDNNTRIGEPMGVGHLPDLVVSEVNAPASVANGQNFTATVKVCNQGTAPAPSSGTFGSIWLELFLSTDTELTQPSPGMPSSDQVSIASVELDQPLAAGACVTKSMSANAWLPQGAQGDGAYHLAAAVDTKWVERELREDNNVRFNGLMGVGNRSDLVVSEVSGPVSLEHGQNFMATVRVCNQGTESSSSSSYSRPHVELYLSMDTELELPSPGSPYPSPGMPRDQMFIGSVELEQSLAPAQCVTLSVPASAVLPQEAQGDGAYYLAAAVDTKWVEQELREDNNSRMGDLVGVGYRPDLVVSEVSGPSSVANGLAFTATVTVCNQGTVPTAQQVWLEVFLSQDADLSVMNPGEPPHDDQRSVGGIHVDPLDVDQCVTLDVPAWADLPYAAPEPGVFHLGAIVDSNSWLQELREDNNTRATSTLEVTAH
ncbi:CARDB domain-containing protein [Archangium minus]